MGRGLMGWGNLNCPPLRLCAWAGRLSTGPDSQMTPSSIRSCVVQFVDRLVLSFLPNSFPFSPISCAQYPRRCSRRRKARVQHAGPERFALDGSRVGQNPQMW